MLPQRGTTPGPMGRSNGLQGRRQRGERLSDAPLQLIVRGEQGPEQGQLMHLPPPADQEQLEVKD